MQPISMQVAHLVAILAGAVAVTPLALPAAQTPTGAGVFDLRVTPLASPASENSGEPQLTVSDRGPLLSWIERAGPLATLKFAERTPTGWAAPRTVASGDDSCALGFSWTLDCERVLAGGVSR